MPTTANHIDLSPLPPASRRELRDFYQFLLERHAKMNKVKPAAATRSITWPPRACRVVTDRALNGLITPAGRARSTTRMIRIRSISTSAATR